MCTYVLIAGIQRSDLPGGVLTFNPDWLFVLLLCFAQGMEVSCSSGWSGLTIQPGLELGSILLFILLSSSQWKQQACTLLITYVLEE